MAYLNKYVIGTHRLKSALADGFEVLPAGTVKSLPTTKASRHLFIRSIDGVDAGTVWGRLSLKARLDGDLVLYIRAIASDDLMFIRKGELTCIDDFLLDSSVTPTIKEQFFGLANGIEASGVTDVLLQGWEVVG